MGIISVDVRAVFFILSLLALQHSFREYDILFGLEFLGIHFGCTLIALPEAEKVIRIRMCDTESVVSPPPNK